MECETRIRVHTPCRAGVLVELSGEFDLSSREALEDALDEAAASGDPVFVDLSGVTFMDALCVRELVRSARPGHLKLCHPSPQVALSAAAACEPGTRLEPCPDDDPGYAAVIREACRCRGPDLALRRVKYRMYLRGGLWELDAGLDGAAGRRRTST